MIDILEHEYTIIIAYMKFYCSNVITVAKNAVIIIC